MPINFMLQHSGFLTFDFLRRRVINLYLLIHKYTYIVLSISPLKITFSQLFDLDVELLANTFKYVR